MGFILMSAFMGPMLLALVMIHHELKIISRALSAAKEDQ